MQFVLVGVNLSSAPVEVLESVAVGRHAMPLWLPRLASHAGGGVFISTCNRAEVYADAADPEAGIARLTEFLNDIAVQSNRAAILPTHFYALRGDDVVRHLFRVTSGLDSLALGEAQIAGQVSDALKAAGEAGVIPHRISRLFHSALRTSRRVRQKTGLGRDRVSVPSIGVQLIERSLGDLKTKSALLIGAGETGELVARALRTAGIGKLVVSSRRMERAVGIARELGGEAVPFERRYAALAESDIAVTCTAATEHVITAHALSEIMRSRPDRPVFVLDVGMPRDVEPAASAVAGVSLRTLHSLEQIAAEHRESRKDAAEQAAILIDREVSRFGERLTGLETEPVIRTLGARAEALRRAELERALRRLPDITDGQRAVLEAMSRSLVSRLLAEPIDYLRSTEDPDAPGEIAHAFGLDSDG